MDKFPIDSAVSGNSGLVKLMLLSQGVRIEPNLLNKTDEPSDYQPNGYYYNVSNEREFCEKYQLPSELLLPNEVESSFYINPKSPFIIKGEKSEIRLFYEEREIFPIEFNRKPIFFERKLQNGSLVRNFASMYGRYILGLFLSWYCDYIAKNHACKFCSLDVGRSTLWKNNAWNITKYHLSEVLSTISETEKERIKYFMYTAWTYVDTDRWILEQADLIRIANTIFWPGYEHHLTTMPPKDPMMLHSLKDAWLTSIAYDFEVHDTKLFNDFCPGKSKFYGRDKMTGSAFAARDIFGKNNVKIGFVWGIEPLETLIEWINYFAKNDFSIAINVFHPDKWTPLGETLNRPSVSYLFDMVRAQRDAYVKYDVVPVFPEGWRRSSLDTEVYRWFFDWL